MDKLKEEIVKNIAERCSSQNIARHELAEKVGLLREKIAEIALALYCEKVGEITRNDVINGKINFNPRHVIKALVEREVINGDAAEKFERLDDEEFYSIIFGYHEDIKTEMLKTIEKTEAVIAFLK